MKKNVLIVLCLIFTYSVKAQNQVEEKKFIPSGTAYAKIYSNFNISIQNPEPIYKFELTRAYFGYKYQMSEFLSANVCLDAGKTTSLEQIVYFKYAALVYQKNKLNLTFGLIGLEHFYQQEKFWGYRYIYKSFLDQNGLSHSADLGATVKYKITPKIKFDATVRNGEGYKNMASDNTLRAGAGFTIESIKNVIVKAYYDIYQKSETQSMITGFVGYKFEEKARIGVEYNMILNNCFKASNDLQGISAFATYSISKKFEIFGRYDKLFSNTMSEQNNPWNYSKDGSTIIGGIQFNPMKHVNIALNYQGYIFDDSKKERVNNVFVNFEYAF
ncbi:MAG: hypothetical protein A2033_14600 [Bacteroidetes bacterium GWA2_31_9]|nr:MAG: hypothetical protein A2033_14600 [Bacteroidetes bacterium GWA2_31_9]